MSDRVTITQNGRGAGAGKNGKGNGGGVGGRRNRVAGWGRKRGEGEGGEKGEAARITANEEIEYYDESSIPESPRTDSRRESIVHGSRRGSASPVFKTAGRRGSTSQSKTPGGRRGSKSPGRRGSTSSSPGKQPDIFRVSLNCDAEGGDGKVKTSSAPLSQKELKVLDELAMLFSIQEERCMRESSTLSKSSLTPSTSSLDASFIYQHVDFQVLGRCVPGFVKTHLNKNCRYLPETFILRVNYWRRRRALGDESKVKSKEHVIRACAGKKDKDPKSKDKKDSKIQGAGESNGNNNGSVASTPRVGSVIMSASSPRLPPTVIISN